MGGLGPWCAQAASAGEKEQHQQGSQKDQHGPVLPQELGQHAELSGFAIRIRATLSSPRIKPTVKESVFFGIGHFLQATFEIIVGFGWTIPVIFIAVLLFGMAYWLYTQTVFTRKSKERGGFI